MDKIVYTCSAEHIGYTFPKRKWWDFSKKVREVRFELSDILGDEEINCCVRIMEEYPLKYCGRIAEGCSLEEDARNAERAISGYDVRISEAYREDIWRAFATQVLYRRPFEILLVIDLSGEEFIDVLSTFAKDKNFLAVFTDNPGQYERLLEQFSVETGLMGMIFTEYKEFVRYQRQVCEEKKALVFMGNDIDKQDEKGKTVFYRFPKESLVLDFSEKGVYYKMLRGKRMEADYTSMPIFLDNMVKNRYNSVVNEGLQQLQLQLTKKQQNVYRADDKSRLSEKRKGIKKWKKRKIF